MTKTILLADDSMTIQKVVELTFMDQDYQVVAVSDGTTAIGKLSELSPDLVIADVHMPGADGYEVCRQTKATRPGTPVLLLVGTFEHFDEGAAAAVGADGNLKKPFDSQELLGQVESLVNQAAAAAPAPAVESSAAAPAIEAPVADALDLPMPSVPEAPAAAPAPSFESVPSFDSPPSFDQTPSFEPAQSFASAPPTFEVPAAEPAPMPPAPEVAAEPAMPEAVSLDSTPDSLGAFGVPEAAPAAPAAPEPTSPWAAPAPETAAPETVLVESLASASVDPGLAVAAPEPSPELPSLELSADPEPATVAAEPDVEAPAPTPEPTAVEPPPSTGDVDGNAETRPMAARQPADGLSDEDVERIARRVAELLSERKIDDVVWEVVPDLAEVVIKERIRQLETQAESA